MKPHLKNFVVNVENGNIVFNSEYQKRLFKHFLRQITGTAWITVDKRVPKRTTRQNSYLWLYYTVILNEGYGNANTEMGLHCYFKKKLLRAPREEIKGEIILHEVSTTNLSISEFSEYITAIEDLTGVPAPDPTPFNLAITHDAYARLKNEANTRKAKK